MHLRDGSAEDPARDDGNARDCDGTGNDRRTSGNDDADDTRSDPDHDPEAHTAREHDDRRAAPGDNDAACEHDGRTAGDDRAACDDSRASDLPASVRMGRHEVQLFAAARRSSPGNLNRRAASGRTFSKQSTTYAPGRSAHGRAPAVSLRKTQRVAGAT